MLPPVVTGSSKVRTKLFLLLFLFSFPLNAFEKILLHFDQLEAFVVRETLGEKSEWLTLTPFSSDAYPAPGQAVPLLADTANVEVAVNANFYREDQPGFLKPIGLVVKNGEILSEPHPNWPSAGWSKKGWIWDQVSIQATFELIDSRGTVLKTKLCRLNAPASFGCASLWTRGTEAKKWRSKQKGKIVVDAKGNGLSIGTTEFVPVTESQKPWILEFPNNVSFKVLQRVKRVRVSVKLNGTRHGEEWNTITEAISGSHVFAEEGIFPPEKFNRPWAAEKQPRTLIGLDSSQRFFVAVFDGRRIDSEGVSVRTAWEHLKAKLDAKWVLNLDGGGSSALVFKKQLLNKPSNGIPRAIAVGIGAKSTL